MSGAARIQMQHFQVARLAAPAAITLAQLQVLDAGPPSFAMLSANPALLLRALDALHRTGMCAPSTSVSERLAAMDASWLDSLIRGSALQLALQDPQSNEVFLVQHWYLSRRLALLAAALAQLVDYADVTNALCCGALLRAGMLVLGQQQTAYVLPSAGASIQAAQLAAERQQFQVDHVEAGVRLLEGWELDQFSIDALRYQAEPLEQVLDAAPLVKCCWYANVLAEGAHAAALHAGRELLGLDAGQIAAVLEQVRQTLDAECVELGMPGLRGDVANEDIAHESRQKLQQLRHEISTACMLAQYGENKAGVAPDAQLARLLQDAGIEPAFIVFEFATEQMLKVRFSHRVTPDPSGLSFVCAAGRNALSALVLASEVGVLTAETCLSAFDRQLLTLLGGQTVLCETLREGNRKMVLLLGMNASAVTAYLAQTTLRRFIARLLLDTGVRNAAAGDALLMQQRIREAVHEANNPLSIIKNYLYVIGMKEGQGSMPEEFQLIRNEIDRVAAILANLREPGATVSHPKKLSLNSEVSTLHHLFARAFEAEGRNISIALQLSETDTYIVARAEALKQIVMNLVRNAAEALGGEGRITLATQTRIYMHDRFYAQLSVRDTGPGIPAEMMWRLFRPGASTKGGAHGGTGLGIVRRLVEEMGGQISCRSDGKGTAMDILLPSSD